MIGLCGNFEIIEGTNGFEAVEYYKKNKPDIIFTDLQMPEKNGLDAFKEIKEIAGEDIKYTKVIAVTAYAMDYDKEKCINAGMDHFIAKPFKLIDIKSALDKFL